MALNGNVNTPYTIAVQVIAIQLTDVLEHLEVATQKHVAQDDDEIPTENSLNDKK